MNVFVEVDVEAEYNIIGIKGNAIREPDVAAQFQGVTPSIRRNLPGCCQRRFRALGIEIDMNEVGEEQPEYLLRRKIHHRHRIQGLWVCTQRSHEAASRPPDFALCDKNFFAGWNRLSFARNNTGAQEEECAKEEYSHSVLAGGPGRNGCVSRQDFNSQRCRAALEARRKAHSRAETRAPKQTRRLRSTNRN